MRVSKAVKDYIYEKVNEKVMEKHRDEIEEENRQRKELKSIIDSATEAAEKAFADSVRKNAAGKDFIEVKGCIEKSVWVRYDDDKIFIKGKTDPFEKRPVYSKAYKEATLKAEEIIVTLELGGTKEDLDRMLSEI